MKKTAGSEASKGGKHSHISEQLRQAVKDLGGDDEDLDLIEGIDDDDEGVPAPVSSKGKGKDASMDEVGVVEYCLRSSNAQQSLKKALGDFMKGLDFGSVPVPAAVDDESEAVSEGDSEEEDEEDEDTEDSEEDEDENDSEDESEASEDESEEERPSAVEQVKKAKDAAKVKVAEVKEDSSASADPNATSGKVRLH
jgi:ribosome biogenesis protein MAK21